MKKISVLFALCALQVASAQQAAVPVSDIENIGASLESVQTLKALVVEQINYYEVSIRGPSVLDLDDWEKRSARGVYTPQTELGHNLKELSGIISARELTVAVSNPNDELYAYVRYYSAPDGRGNSQLLFYGSQSFKLVATKKGTYKFPQVEPSMRMVDIPEIRFPGVQLSSVRVTERGADGQMLQWPQYFNIEWQAGAPSVRIPAYLVEGERQGEIVFQYWKDNKLNARVFDLGTGVSLEQSSGGGTVSVSIGGVIVIDNDDVVLDLPEGGQIPLIQFIVPMKREFRFLIRGIVNGVPEAAGSMKVRQIGQGFQWGEGMISEGGSREQVEPGVYWVIPVFKNYGGNLPPEYYKPQQPQQPTPVGSSGSGGGGVRIQP